MISISTISEILSSPPNNFSTTLSGNVSSSGLTIALNDVTGLGTEGVGVIYQKDSDGNPVTSTIEFIHWTGVSSLNLTLTDTGDRGISGSASSAQAHNSGDTFEVWTHSAYYPLNAVTLTKTQTLVNKTLTSPVINTPKVGTGINDTNNNELLKVTATASAVNELTLANAATGASPTISATGGDTNIDITLTPKGTGRVKGPIGKRITTATDATSITPNTDNCDITYQANTQTAGTLTINADGGTPTNGQFWELWVKCTNAQTPSFNAQYIAMGMSLPTSFPAGKNVKVLFQYDSGTSKWGCLAANTEA